MTRLRQDVDRLALELAWSQWRELGVGATSPRHQWHAIDLEPLIVFTSGLGSDTRLRARTIDWCITNARFTSALRLRHFAARATLRTRKAFGRYAATVKVHSALPWPAQGDPYVMLPRDHQEATPDLRRPSLVQLRLRALVGVSARAEILKVLLAGGDGPQTASALAETSGYAKGGIAQALDMLTMAGLLNVEPSANRLVYRLANPQELGRLLRWLPVGYPDWQAVFRIVERLVEYAEAATGRAAQRLSPAAALFAAISCDLARLGVDAKVPTPVDAATLVNFEDWALEFLSAQTEGRHSASSHQAFYILRREGSEEWTAGIATPAGLTRPLLDASSTGAQDVATAMFRDALDPDAEWDAMDAVCTEFADEVLRALHPGHSATYTAEFVRRWYGNRRKRFEAIA